ncbi:uncharacterized protein LOC112567134 [Pomacea canaliculata]|uniref:uncharacterized protein LOC112567134 n=1 Tax=Pomacea canaliculata TaxID=400727 RepID=UPI000D736C1F|nr:uncharacterized protein LOC112567134 [Pomacea canaliculata]
MYPQLISFVLGHITQISCASTACRARSAWAWDTSCLSQLNTLKTRIEQQKSKLEICGPLATAILNGLETRFADAYKDQDTLLATVSNPRCKLMWTGDQTLREKCRSLLTAEAALMDTPLINTPVQSPTKCSAEQADFFIYEEVTGTPEATTFLMSGLSQNVNELDK